MVLKVDGAPAGRGGEVDPVLGEGLLVLGHPVAEGVRVVGGDNGDRWKARTFVKIVLFVQLLVYMTSPTGKVQSLEQGGLETIMKVPSAWFQIIPKK